MDSPEFATRWRNRFNVLPAGGGGAGGASRALPSAAKRANSSGGEAEAAGAVGFGPAGKAGAVGEGATGGNGLAILTNGWPGATPMGLDGPCCGGRGRERGALARAAQSIPPIDVGASPCAAGASNLWEIIGAIGAEAGAVGSTTAAIAPGGETPTGAKLKPGAGAT